MDLETRSIYRRLQKITFRGSLSLPSGVFSGIVAKHYDNKMINRVHFLPSGSKLELGDEASRIPVVLIQHPGNQPQDGAGAERIGLGSGWDIILPARWAMAFWIPLVYR